MIIDLKKMAMIKKDLLQITDNGKKIICKDILRKLSKEYTPSKYDISSILEEYIDFYSPNKELFQYFKNKNVLVYHATRVLSIEKIQEEGLFCNDLDRYITVIQKALNKTSCSTNEKKESAILISNEYKRKYPNGSKLCFFLNEKDTYGEKNAGYSDYCKILGGEVALGALKGKMNSVLLKLETIGLPIVISISLPFSCFTDISQRKFIREISLWLMSSVIWDKYYDVHFDGETSFDINPNEIIEIKRIDE